MCVGFVFVCVFVSVCVLCASSVRECFVYEWLSCVCFLCVFVCLCVLCVLCFLCVCGVCVFLVYVCVCV